MSSIGDFFSHLFKTTAAPPTRISIKPDHYIKNGTPADGSTGVIGQTALSGQHYVRLWVNRMLLADSTEWFTTLYPAVYSVVHLHFGDNDLDLANLAGPKQLGDLKPADMNHSLSINVPMTGLLPFRGGTFQLSCGLAQMPIDNILANFMNTLGDFASKLAQPQVSLGISIASSVASGVQSLLGAGKAKLKLYFDQTFTGVPGEQTLRSGFIFLSDQPSGEITQDQIWVIDGEPRIGSSKDAARPIKGQNYFLIQIEVLAERDDWNQFKTIEDPLQKAISAKISGKADEAKGSLLAARLAAYDSDDLTDADKLRVIQMINAAYDAAPDSSPDGTSVEAPIKLASLMQDAVRIDVSERLALPAREELFSLA